MAAQFQFVMRSGPNVGKVYPLEAQEISIGRDNSNMVAINDVEVSRRHAKVELRGSAYVIQDLGSTNGTFVNGQRVSGIQVLNPGDTVSFGEGIMLVYEAVYDPNATVVASSARAARTMAPLRRPAPTPTPISVPPLAYSGQVPAGPVPVAAAPAKKGGGKWVIIVIVAAILILCLCIGVPVIADALKLDCTVPFKWFFNIVGPMFGYSACP
jgi:predicted component of type VI protein secretion system